ncbi:LLM class flavin-dependent oxidoreductase [Gracilimonas amylolytica]|uniref:LLM class flavin-dependent oxidoreductase n=1 Tax=Gracilimonas amylolytica TaxID=1749045 RepID=UPI000CD8C658|nr:LLM class flavin-dependent oxidoreductase [Gracilimonas amylolytica]
MFPYSVLDLAVVTEGSNAKEAIERSRELAVHAENLGYNRFWMAEHHNMEHIASSATSVLLGHMAEATSSIRIGSGGIMLPNHSPYIIAEHFGTLATMYPDRIDLGLGRAPGTDQTTAHAIRPDRMREVYNFPKNVELLQKYLSADNSDSKVRAFPGEGTEVPLWVLGSSTDSAHLAAKLGLPYAFASHFAPQQLLEAIRIYREEFKPSAQLDEPYVMAGINVIAADTTEQAEYLATSTKQMFVGVITGERKPLPPPVDDINRVLPFQHQMALKQMLAYSFVGDKKKIRENLKHFMDQTNVDELITASYIFDHQERLKSHTLFSELMESIKAEAI